MRYTNGFKNEQKEMIKVATDLEYKKIYVDALKNASSIPEMDRIMKNARKDKFGDE